MIRFVKTIAVASVLFAGAAQAAGLDLATTFDYDFAVQAAKDEFDTKTLSADANFAIIAQSGTDGVAHIVQAGETNFAVITQSSADAMIAVITQSGSGNRAYISQ